METAVTASAPPLTPPSRLSHRHITFILIVKPQTCKIDNGWLGCGRSWVIQWGGGVGVGGVWKKSLKGLNKTWHFGLKWLYKVWLNQLETKFSTTGKLNQYFHRRNQDVFHCLRCLICLMGDVWTHVALILSSSGGAGFFTSVQVLSL